MRKTLVFSLHTDLSWFLLSVIFVCLNLICSPPIFVELSWKLGVWFQISFLTHLSCTLSLTLPSPCHSRPHVFWCDSPMGYVKVIFFTVLTRTAWRWICFDSRHRRYYRVHWDRICSWDRSGSRKHRMLLHMAFCFLPWSMGWCHSHSSSLSP